MNRLPANPPKTLLTISMGFLLIFVIGAWKPALSISLLVGLIGVFSTFLSKKIEFLWMKLAWLLSLIVPNILLSLIFFLILLPMAFLSRLFGKRDPLNIKSTDQSLYREVNKQFDKASFETTW